MGAWDFDFAGGYKHIPLAFNFGGVRHRKYVQSGSRTWLPVGWAYIRSLWSKGVFHTFHTHSSNTTSCV
eukprot:9487059-Pyramimonas_sp.AAC.2